MGILDYAKITDKGIADAVGESLQMTFINLLSVEMTAAAIVLGKINYCLTTFKCLTGAKQSACPRQGQDHLTVSLT